MMVNEFQGRVYTCGTDCHCSYFTPGQTCQIAGETVLESYEYSLGKQGEWAGILVSIIVVYRLLSWGVLWLRR